MAPKLRDNPRSATANDQAGVVLNGDQQYVWERGNRKDKIQIAERRIPEPYCRERWMNMRSLMHWEGLHGIKYDGCTLESVLYQVSEGRAVGTHADRRKCRDHRI